MDLKKFESLSDLEKIKILKICEILSQKTQLDQENDSAPSKSTGKQKTLDGWLLKSKESKYLKSNSSSNKCEEKRTSSENVGSLNVTENSNTQDVVESSDSKISESQEDKTLNHDFVIATETCISDDVAENSKNKLNLAKNVELISKTENELTELERHNTLINDIVKKNPFVLIERLNFTDVPRDSITSTASLPDRTFHSNEESSQQVILEKNTNTEIFNAVKTSSLETSTSKGSSCSDKHREAYLKLKKICSNHELNLDDIFQAQEFKNMIEKFKCLPEAVLFIGSHKCETTGKVKPIVNYHKSKKELETLISSNNQK